ncbi:MAG TPA: Hpt domain-containing protein [Xanthobacteraceae bacterium]|jgi:HPt (histidine-containing phosphotransfer) domain-containing protein|nr:Hpt domain-containing protein [Xanthobacteraceae bacterium]
MSKSRKDEPSVATYADHEVISPPHRLSRAISKGPASGDDDPVARAEQALKRLAQEFPSWMEQEGERLDRARNRVKTEGFTVSTRDALFFAAHDIKGGARTLGYPGLAVPAASLCRLIEHTPDMRRIPMTLLDQHVDAIRAIVREHRRPDAEQTVAALTARLTEVTEEFLASENRDHPEELEDILSPPVAPGDTLF